jgi:hypothetical protein
MAGSVDKTEGNAGVRPSGSKAALPASLDRVVCPICKAVFYPVQWNGWIEYEGARLCPACEEEAPDFRKAGSEVSSLSRS